MTRICFGRALLPILGSCMALLFPACGSPESIGSGGLGGNGGGPAGSGGAGGVKVTLTLPDQGGATGTGGAMDGGIAISIDGGAPIATCGTTSITPNRAPVDVFVVLDRSASMYYSIAGDCYCAASITGGTTSPICESSASCTNRWDSVSAALKLTMDTITTINWGLEMYPTPGGDVCTVSGDIQVPLGTPDSASAVKSAVLRGAPRGNTPTAAAVKAAAAYVPTVNDGIKKAILLATDGVPNCYQGQITSTDDMATTLTEIGAAYAIGLPVYVIGIGPSVGNLDSMAQAGGTQHFYPATSPKQLADALYEISRIVATTCTFQTPGEPPVDSKVWVYIDKQFVPQSATEGWTFGGNTSTIVLTGTTCQNLLAGSSSNVQVIFGCPDVPPPPVIP